MKIVADANEIFASIIVKGKYNTQSKGLKILFSDEVELFAPYRLLAEIEHNRVEIKKKACFSAEEFDSFAEVLKIRIKFTPLEEFMDKVFEARDICPDIKDIEYFGLSLKLHCGIWSEETSFKRQNKVKIFTTDELEKVIRN